MVTNVIRPKKKYVWFRYQRPQQEGSVGRNIFQKNILLRSFIISKRLFQNFWGTNMNLLWGFIHDFSVVPLLKQTVLRWFQPLATRMFLRMFFFTIVPFFTIVKNFLRVFYRIFSNFACIIADMVLFKNRKENMVQRG